MKLILALLLLANVASASNLTDLYLQVYSSYNVFPPLGMAAEWTSGEISPIDASVLTLLLSVDVISPGDSEFTVTVRTAMYWNREACNSTEAHQYACGNKVNNMHFIAPENAPSEHVFSASYFEKIHEEEMIALGFEDLIPSVEIVEEQITFRQQFDVETYPYEYHWLTFTFGNSFSNNVVNLTQFPIATDIIQPTVPNGWTFQRAYCGVVEDSAKRASGAISGNSILFSNYQCNILVSRDNTGWWMTSFLLFVGINVISFVQGLGRTSHLIAEARDDKDSARGVLFEGMRMNGIFSIGLLLTYVFQVQISPYNQPVEFWPNVAASTEIYILGLIGILLAAALPIIMGLVMKKLLVVDGFTGGIRRAYKLADVPKEGRAPEEDFPLLDKDWEKGHPGVGAEGADEENPTFGDDGSDEKGKTEGAVEQAAPDGSDKENASIEESGYFEKGKTEGADKEAVGEAAPEIFPPTPHTRKCNSKVYPVLSVKEASRINYLVNIEFWILATLPATLAALGTWILITAKKDFDDAIA